MVNYLVAVDASKNAKAAFYTALNTMNKQQDHLFVVSIVKDIEPVYALSFGEDVAAGPMYAIQKKLKHETECLLRYYGNLCKQNGVACTLLLAVASHVGEMLCTIVKTKNITVMLLGRRGMSTLKRIFVGSTSRYCLENAECSVMVVKGDWGPMDEHVDVQKINQLEEAERKRRMADSKTEKELAHQLADTLLPIISMHHKDTDTVQ